MEGSLLVRLIHTGPQEATCPGPGVQPRWKGCGRGADIMPQSDLNMQVCCHCSSVSTGVDNASGPGRNVSEAGGERQVAPPLLHPSHLDLKEPCAKRFSYCRKSVLPGHLIVPSNRKLCQPTGQPTTMPRLRAVVCSLLRGGGTGRHSRGSPRHSGPPVITLRLCSPSPLQAHRHRGCETVVGEVPSAGARRQP